MCLTRDSDLIKIENQAIGKLCVGLCYTLLLLLKNLIENSDIFKYRGNYMKRVVWSWINCILSVSYTLMTNFFFSIPSPYSWIVLKQIQTIISFHPWIFHYVSLKDKDFKNITVIFIFSNTVQIFLFVSKFIFIVCLLKSGSKQYL